MLGKRAFCGVHAGFRLPGLRALYTEDLLSTDPRTAPASSQRANSSCATIAATATVLPEHTITRDDVKYYMGRVFDINERRLEAMMTIVDNAQVQKRHAIFPIEYTVEPRALEKTNQEYIEHAVK